MAIFLIFLVLTILVVLLSIFLIPVNLILEYESELVIKLKIFLFNFKLYKQSKEKESNLKEKKSVSSKQFKIAENIKKIGIVNFINIIIKSLKTSAEIAKETFDAIQINNLNLTLKIGGKDASAVAMMYGKVCSAVYPALGYISSLTPIKVYEISIQPEFTNEKTKLNFKLDVKVSIFCLFKVSFKYFKKLKNILNLNV